jgi:uncharacterized protein
MLAASACLTHTHDMAPSAQSLGGRARARNLPREKRRSIARKAARARWIDPRRVLEDRAALESFCKRYGIRKLYAFGSIVTSTFGRASDVDLLYVPDRRLDYATLFDAVEELRALFGRNVDFIDRAVIERSQNEFRRKAILGTAKLVYEAN